MPPDRPFRLRSTADVLRMSKAADAHLGQIIDRLNQVDPEFREVLHLTLQLDEEKARRGRPPE